MTLRHGLGDREFKGCRDAPGVTRATRRCADEARSLPSVVGKVHLRALPAPDRIADLLPSAGARVLITSRFSDWSELADDVALDVLLPEEAVRAERLINSQPAPRRKSAFAMGRWVDPPLPPASPFFWG